MQLILSEEDARWSELCHLEIFDGLMIAFEGGLGAGKSSLVRHWLRSLGVQGSIRSQTYTLCEYYEPSGRCKVAHIDAYRLQSDNDWDMLGLDLLEQEKHSLWIEWCSLHPYYYNRCDLHINIDMTGRSELRQYTLQSNSVVGQQWLDHAAIIFNTESRRI